MSFAALKKSSKGNLANLQKKLEEQNSKTDYSDDRLWYPVRDKTGNAACTIRFLPTAEGDTLPWVKTHTHGFKGPTGRWYIENCPTTIGKKCPLCESNSEYWATGTDEGKNIARARKRRVNYYSNIYVIKDPKTPENEGKVFLFRYGQKIFDQIQSAMKPEFEGEEPLNPFDLWNGADYLFRVRVYEGNTNYDKSAFSAPAPLLEGDDAKLEAVWKSQHRLSEFIDPGQYKTYEELKARLDSVIGNRSVTTAAEDDEDTDFDVTNTVTEDQETPEIDESELNVSDKDTDDVLAQFQKMAEEE